MCYLTACLAGLPATAVIFCSWEEAASQSLESISKSARTLR